MTEFNPVEMTTIRPPNSLQLKAPPLEDHKKWVAAEIDNYLVATRYLAFFFEARSRMDDMTEEEVWDEIKANVSMMARSGYDILGTQ